jgi:non-specific serine/threonine protein kinase
MEEGVRRYLEIGNKWGAAMLLTYSAAIPLEQGDHVRAARLAQQGLALARELGDRIGVYASLFNLALLARARHDRGEARRLFQEALVLSVDTGDKGNTAYCLEALAEEAASEDDLVRAAQLWGAAEALLEIGEAAVYAHTTDRSSYEQSVSAARGKLDVEQWEAAWGEGRQMTLERAIAYALDGA